jgi:hypothetical protein
MFFSGLVIDLVGVEEFFCQVYFEASLFLDSLQVLDLHRLRIKILSGLSFLLVKVFASQSNEVCLLIRVVLASFVHDII